VHLFLADLLLGKENVQTLIDAVSRAKPSGAKGTYIQRIALSSTMGPGVRLDVAGTLSNNSAEGK